MRANGSGATTPIEQVQRFLHERQGGEAFMP